MKNLIFMAFVLMTLAYACDNKPKNPIAVKQEKLDNTVTEYQMDTIRKVKQGYYKVTINGKLVTEKEFRNDSLVGVEKHYHDNGKLKAEILVDKGKFNGPFKYFHDNGKLYQEGKHVDEYIEGDLKTYYPNGQLKEQVFMLKSEMNGPFVEYFDNGKLKAKGSYDKNKEHCLLEMYKEDASGELEFKKICRTGVCCTFWSLAKGDVKPSSEICSEVLKDMKQKCATTAEEKK